MKVAFEIVGQTPLLMHRDDVDAADELSSWRRAPENKGVTVAGDDRSPGWTWQTYLHHDGEFVAVPMEWLMAALKTAGAQMTLKKQKTFKEATQSGIFVPTEFIELRVGKDNERVAIEDVVALRDKPFSAQAQDVQDLGFRLFVKRAKVGMSKHVRVRPRFDRWTARGEIEVVAPEITFEIVSRLFDLAGRGGFGDWRPASKSPGAFGMFTAKIKKVA